MDVYESFSYRSKDLKEVVKKFDGEDSCDWELFKEFLESLFRDQYMGREFKSAILRLMIDFQFESLGESTREILELIGEFEDVSLKELIYTRGRSRVKIEFDHEEEIWDLMRKLFRRKQEI